MTHHRLDGGPTPHLAPDRRGDATHLARDPDLELLRMNVTTIALVDEDAARLYPGERLEISNQGFRRMAIEGIANQRSCVQHELASVGHSTLGDLTTAVEKVSGLEQ